MARRSAVYLFNINRFPPSTSGTLLALTGTNKEMARMRGEMSTTLLYLESPEVNDEVLILEIVKRTVGTETRVPE